MSDPITNMLFIMAMLILVGAAVTWMYAWWLKGWEEGFRKRYGRDYDPDDDDPWRPLL